MYTPASCGPRILRASPTSEGSTPQRFIPVLTFRWTVRSGWVEIRFALGMEWAVTASRCSAASGSLSGKQVGEDQDRDFEARAPQFSPLLDGDDGEGVCTGFDAGAGHLGGAVAVGVRLHDGHQA